MSTTPFKELPLEALYDLLVSSVQELLEAMETHEDGGIALRARKKQVEVIHASIVVAKQQKQKAIASYPGQRAK